MSYRWKKFGKLFMDWKWGVSRSEKTAVFGSWAQSSIRYVIENSVMVVQEAHKLLREVLSIEPIPEDSDLCLWVPVRSTIQAASQRIEEWDGDNEVTVTPMLRLRGGAQANSFLHVAGRSSLTSRQREVWSDFLWQPVRPYLRVSEQNGA